MYKGVPHKNDLGVDYDAQEQRRQDHADEVDTEVRGLAHPLGGGGTRSTTWQFGAGSKRAFMSMLSELKSIR